jgi:hypothetical protein
MTATYFCAAVSALLLAGALQVEATDADCSSAFQASSRLFAHTTVA